MTTPRPGRHSGLALLLLGSTAVGTYVEYSIGALGPTIASRFHVGDAQVGLLLTALFIVAAALSPILAGLVSSIGPKAALMLLLMSGAIAMALASASAAYWQLVLAVTSFAVPLALTNLVTNKLAIEGSSPRLLGLTIGIKQSGTQSGSLLGSVLLPLGVAAVGWRWTWLWCCLAPAALLALSLRTVSSPQQPSPAKAIASCDGALRTFRRWTDTYSMVMAAAGLATLGFASLYLSNNGTVSPQLAPLIVTCMSATAIIGRIAWSQITFAYIPMSCSMGSVAGAAAVGCALMTTAPILSRAWMAWTGACVWGISAGAWIAVVMIGTITYGPTHYTALTASILRATFVGAAIGPMMFSVVISILGYTFAWILVCLMYIAAVAIAVASHVRGPQEYWPPASSLTV